MFSTRTVSHALNICSLNWRGVGSFEIQKDVFNYLRAKSLFSTYMLQDVHFTKQEEHLFDMYVSMNVFLIAIIIVLLVPLFDLTLF